VATNNSNNTKTVTVVNYNDPVPGSTPLLQVLNSPGGNKYEIQINNGAGGFAATNSFVYSPVTGNVGLRGNLAVTGKISGKMTTSTQNLQIVGGTSGYVLSTDGTGNISWVDPMDGQYGNSNVANYLPTYNGDIGLDNITITGNTTAVNINATSITSNTLTSSENSYLYNVSATGLASLTTVTVGGNFTMNGGTANLGQASRVKITGGAADYFLQTDGTGNVTWAPIATSSTLQQVTTAGHTTNVAVQFTNSTQSINQTTGAVVVTGGIAAGGNVHGNHIHAATSIYAQQTVYSGQNSIGSSFTKPLFIGKDTGDEYVQAAMVNSNSNGSADWAAYSDSGGDAQGWIDMGFTGTTFSDANYSITHPSDGYIFVEGMPAQGGNLILATGDLGNPTHRDIIFATGGFAEENEFARIDHANNQFKLTRSGSTLKFVDGTVFSGNEITTATTDSFSVTTSSLSSVSASCYIGLPNEFVADTEFNDDITVVQVGWTVIVDSVEYTVTYIDPAPPANQYRITVDGTAGFVSGSSYTFTNPVPVEHTWSIDQYGTITAPAGAEISQINDDFKIEVTGTDIIDLRTQGGDFILDAEGNININGPINSSTGVSRLDLTGGSVYLTSTDDDTTVLDMNNTKVEMYAGVDVNLTSGVLLPQLSTDYTDSTNVLELLFTENEGEVGYPWGITLPVSHITYNELILLEPDTFPNQAACTTQAYNTQNTWELWQDTIAQSKVRITSNELTWTFDSEGNLTLPSNTSSINYPNGNPYGGGGGSANTGNVTFNDQSVIGTGDQYGGSGLYLAPGTESVGNLQYLRVRGGDYPTHIHLDTGNYEYYDQYFGNDNKYLKLSAGANGNIIIGTDDTTGNLYNWTFDSDGNLTVPGNIKTINSGFTLSVPDITNVTGTNEAGVPGVSGSQTFNAQLAYSPGIDTVQVGWTVTGNNLVGTTTVTAVDEYSPGFYEITTDTAVTNPFWYNDVYTFTGTGYASWNFANTGYLTFPRDSAANTDPYLRIVGGTDPAIISEDASLAGPSNLDIVALNTIFSGFTGTEIRIYPDDGEIGSTANLQLWANAGSNVAQYSWTHDTTGSLILPTISTGEGTDEQSIVRSQRKIIPALHYSAAIDGATPTVVYTASSNGINSLKITISMTHSALGQEMFDISAMAAGANVMYSVSNRLNGTGQPDTSVSVDYDGSNRLAITLTVNSGATTSWVTYDSTEFGFQVD
jgi:hypothetical protein